MKHQQIPGKDNVLRYRNSGKPLHQLMLPCKADLKVRVVFEAAFYISLRNIAEIGGADYIHMAKFAVFFFKGSTPNQAEGGT